MDPADFVTRREHANQTPGASHAGSRRPAKHRIAIGLLLTVHVLGMLGSPFAASLHLYQEGASAHQNFHVVWEAFKYCAASILAVGVVLGPLASGQRWAWWLVLAASLLLFGGVFVSHWMTAGGPVIDFWAYGSFLVVSVGALLLLDTKTGAEGRP